MNCLLSISHPTRASGIVLFNLIHSSVLGYLELKAKFIEFCCNFRNWQGQSVSA